MRHTTESVEEITTMFRDRSLPVPQYMSDAEIRKTWYYDMLIPDIWKVFY